MIASNDEVHPYSRKSSLGISQEDNTITENKMSRKLITIKLKDFHVEEKV